MRTISPDTRRLIDYLNRPARLLERLIGLRDDDAVLFEIGNSAEPAAIIDILPFVLADRKEVAGTAARAVHRLVTVASPTDLAWLDSEWRVRSPYGATHGLEWHKLPPTKLNLLESFGDASTSVLGMASFHVSGYVREEAVKRLDLITSGAEVPFLLLRLNDWVANVRNAAYKTIRSRLNAPYCRSFIANLALVSRLEHTQRVDSRPIIEAIHELLKGAGCRSQLLEALSSTDRFIRRASFRLLILLPDPGLSELLRLALGDNDTVIRSWAAQRVSSALEGPALDQILTLMSRDRFMPVRREALRIRVSRAVEQGRDELRAALLDPHASIREEARYRLRQLGSLDVASFYRRTLTAGDESSLYSAVSGLGETGADEDGDLLIPYASHSAAKIRRAAIKSLARLNTGAHLEVLIEGLMDNFSSVSAEGLKALANSASLVGNERLWEIFCGTSHGHVKRNAQSLLERLGKWDSIYFMLKSTSGSDDEIAARARLSIQRWLSLFNSTFYAPTSEQIFKLRNALEDCGDHLDQKTKEELRFSIKSF